MNQKDIILNFFKSGRKVALVVPIILGFLFSAAARFNETNGLFKPYDAAFLLNGVYYSIMFVIVFFALEKGILSIRSRLNKVLPEDHTFTRTHEHVPVDLPLEFIAPSWKGMKKYLLITGLFWLPTYLFLFPGIMMGDTAVQIEGYLSGDVIVDWHPFFETKLYGKFFSLGGIDNPMLGVGIFIALQMIIGAFVVAYVAYYVQNIVGFRHAGIAACILLSVYPVASLNCMTMNKDTSFAICFMLFCVLYCEVWRSRGKFLKQPAFLIAFIVVSLLAMYTKKTGPYLIAVALMLMIFMKGKKTIRCSICAGGVVLLLFTQVFMPTFVFPKINVTTGPKQEMLAIPEQQLARVVKDFPEEFNDQEKQIIDDIIAVGFDGISGKYNNYLVDPIKQTYLPNEKSIGAFLKLWAKKGLEHPWEYIVTEIGLESGWFAFSGNAVKGAYVYSSPTDSYSANSLSTKITWPEASAASCAWASWYNNLSNTPILNFLMYVCLWASIVPFFLVFYLWRRSKYVIDALISQMPLLLSMGMLLLCPTSGHARYMLPMMLAAPIFIAIAIRSKIRE